MPQNAELTYNLFRLVKLFCMLYKGHKSRSFSLKKEDDFFFEMVFGRCYDDEIFEGIAITVDALNPKSDLELEIAMVHSMASRLSDIAMTSKSEKIRNTYEACYALSLKALMAFEGMKCK